MRTELTIDFRIISQWYSKFDRHDQELNLQRLGAQINVKIKLY